METLLYYPSYNLKHLDMRKLWLLANYTISKFTDMLWHWNIHWGYFLINTFVLYICRIFCYENVFWSENCRLPFTDFIKSKLQLYSLWADWHFKWIVLQQRVIPKKAYVAYPWRNPYSIFMKEHFQYNFPCLISFEKFVNVMY